jgi:hypothetical protein
MSEIIWRGFVGLSIHTILVDGPTAALTLSRLPVSILLQETSPSFQDRARPRQEKMTKESKPKHKKAVQHVRSPDTLEPPSRAPSLAMLQIPCLQSFQQGVISDRPGVSLDHKARLWANL